MTNEEYAQITKSSPASVDRKLKNLDKLGFITRNTVRTSGKAIRTIAVNTAVINKALEK